MNIRRQIFIEDQKVPEEDEVDGLDSESDHYLLKLNNQAIGTARVRYLNEKAKIERVAILSAYQGQGLGQKLIKYLLKSIKNKNLVNKIILGSQTHAIPFYEKVGFTVCSEEYLDADIPHKDMVLIL